MRRRLLSMIVLACVGVAVGLQCAAAAEQIIERVDFVDADLREVFRSLGLAGEFNVLLTQEVQGMVTLTLRQMPVREAIATVARVYEYDFRWLSDNITVVIGKSDKLRVNFDLETRVYSLYYSSVDEIAVALKVVVDDNQIAKNPRTNQLSVVGSPLQLENVDEIIDQMDRPMPQVNIEARMEEISEDSVQDLGIDWDDTLGLSLGGSFTIQPSAPLTAKLNMLASQNKSVTLAQPNVSCLDSNSAEILLGDRLPIMVTNIEDGEVKVITQFIDVGTKLHVTPRVNMDNIVTVKIMVEVSTLLGTTSSGLPQIRMRTTESMARLRDGETLVLTGLIQREEVEDVFKVPILGDLPVLSALFKSKKLSNRNTVICVFITPHIVPVSAEELPRRNQSASSTTTPAAPAAPTASSTGSTTTPTDGTTPAVPVQPPAGVSTVKPDDSTAAGTVPDAGDAAVSDTSDATVPDTDGTEVDVDQPTITDSQPDPGDTEPVNGTEPADSGVVPLVPVDADRPDADNSATNAPDRPSLPRPEEIKHLSYKVNKGDTPTLIAKKFGVDWQDIAAYNRIDTNAVLRVGQVLLVPIPDDHKYVVKPKETLWRIAKRYGLTVELLAEINGITDPTKIEIGQVIVLSCSVNRVVNPEY